MIKSDEHTTCPYTLRAELKIYKKALEYACQDLDVKGIAFNRLPINQVIEWYLMKAKSILTVGEDKATGSAYAHESIQIREDDRGRS